MKRATTILLGITFLLATISPAGAVIVTVDPNNPFFPLVTDPSNPPANSSMDTSSFGVLLFTRLGIDPGNETRVFAVTSYVTGSSNRVFGHLAHSATPPYPSYAPDFGRSWGGQSEEPDHFEYFEARFDTPTDWVSLDFIPNGSSDKNGYLSAWTSNDILIDKIYTNNAALVVGAPMTLSISAPPGIGIGKVFASWDDGDRCQNGELDNLRFETEIIPEPSSIVIWSLIGLTCGMLCYRRKRRTAA